MTHGTRIIVKCSDCGVLRVSPGEVTVRSCIDDGTWSYRFMCPRCRGRNVGDSAMTVLLDAVDAGAGFEAWTRPANLHDRPDGPPFTLADVSELRRLMVESNWLDDVARFELDPDQ